MGSQRHVVLQLLLEFLTVFRDPIHRADGIEEHDAAALTAAWTAPGEQSISSIWMRHSEDIL
ncbi:hypothetical protein IFM46972_08367 [Aspergillus udagawae]|uniref:Uncharacterized protein n=1 Tax=Aspergillus udagawae TaxID=91492 RepID=A0A8H3S5K2_9EURO|nr:hypothetical protein IFM46972_08367 [Aspergillus udagawae]